ncbi:LysR family transcriptional regulator [Dehalobacter sp. 4CP]|uniref:LysR family transcriptional regulator n=1 Tax=Dehalobacter sp. CP TaxID=2594474 RepID=UPI0039EA632D
MNFLQMKQFSILAKHQNMTEAAEELYISQPVLSKLLKKFEKYLNCELFTRKGRNIELNLNGRIFLESIDIILNEYQKINEHFFISKNVDIPIKISGFNKNELDLLIVNFSRQYPNISIEKNPNTPMGALNLLLNKKSDVIFTDNFSLNKFNLETKNIDFINLFRNYLYVSVLPNNVIAQENEISLNELLKYEFIGAIKNTWTSEFIENVCDNEKVNINYVHKYKMEMLDKIFFSTPYLVFCDSINIAYFTNYREIRKHILIKNAFQDIYLCYRKGDNRINLLVENIKNTFHEIFNYS